MTSEIKQQIEKSYSKEFIDMYGYEFLEMMLPLQSFEDACEIEKIDASKAIPDFEFFPDQDREAMKSISKLVIIISAANRLANNGEKWIPNWDDLSERKYENWFSMNVGSSGFRCDYCAYWTTDSSVGSRLCFIKRLVGKYVAEQFIELHKSFFL